jgi:hypothetical protein
MCLGGSFFGEDPPESGTEHSFPRELMPGSIMLGALLLHTEQDLQDLMTWYVYCGTKKTLLKNKYITINISVEKKWKEHVDRIPKNDFKIPNKREKIFRKTFEKMDGFSFVTPVTGFNRPNTGKEDDDDDENKYI